MKIIDYDRDFYKTLIETARLVPIKPLGLFPQEIWKNLQTIKLERNLFLDAKTAFMKRIYQI